ncbi:MAG: ZIP family metal transporter [Candidatus Rokubacteria bacterium]|nr:ZIP family metal transporter [Candidatus Rokubacteria bacterium]
MTQYQWSLVLGAVAGLADLLGALVLTRKAHWDRAFLKYSLAVGAGFMLATAFVRMLPESVEKLPHAFLFVLAGYFGIHRFAHSVAPHVHFGEEEHPEALLDPSVGYLALLGLGVHTFFDGVTIASGFLAGPSLGFLLFFAMLLHKLPEGFTIASVMLASGRSRTAAAWAAGLLGGSTLLGVVLTSLLAQFGGYALALSAGVTIYVAASDLIPEVNRERGQGVAWAVFGGLVLFALADWVISSLGLH